MRRHALRFLLAGDWTPVIIIIITITIIGKIVAVIVFINNCQHCNLRGQPNPEMQSSLSRLSQTKRQMQKANNQMQQKKTIKYTEPKQAQQQKFKNILLCSTQNSLSCYRWPVSRPQRDPGISRDPGIGLKSRSRDFWKSHPGIFRDLVEHKRQCFQRLLLGFWQL